MSDKIKEFRDKNPLLDFISGFIPGISEAQDAHDFYHAAKNRDFGGMTLASIGILTPVSGRFVRQVFDKAGWMKWAKQHLDELSVKRPKLAQKIAAKDPQALKVEKTLNAIGKGEFYIPKKGELVVPTDQFIIPNVHSSGYSLTPAAIVNAGIEYQKMTPKGQIVNNIIGGTKGIKGVVELDANKVLKKKGVKTGNFTASDILTSLYYSGHGKVKSSNEIYKAIEDLADSPQSKDFAQDQLKIIETIMQKYSKSPEGKTKFLSTDTTKPGRNPVPANERMFSQGPIPEELISPNTEEAIKDRINLEYALNRLSTWFGASPGVGVVEMYGKIPQNVWQATLDGKSFKDIKGITLGGKHVKDQDEVAMEIAQSKVPTLGILNNIVDGAGKQNDIIFAPGQYSFMKFKKGGKV